MAVSNLSNFLNVPRVIALIRNVRIDSNLTNLSDRFGSSVLRVIRLISGGAPLDKLQVPSKTSFLTAFGECAVLPDCDHCHSSIEETAKYAFFYHSMISPSLYNVADLSAHMLPNQFLSLDIVYV